MVIKSLVQMKEKAKIYAEMSRTLSTQTDPSAEDMLMVRHVGTQIRKPRMDNSKPSRDVGTQMQLPTVVDKSTATKDQRAIKKDPNVKVGWSRKRESNGRWSRLSTDPTEPNNNEKPKRKIILLDSEYEDSEDDQADIVHDAKLQLQRPPIHSTSFVKTFPQRK